MEIDWIAFGKRIQEVRKSVGFSQEELAETIGISTISRSRIEQGKQHPSVSTLWKVAQELQVSIDYLLDGMDSPQTQKVLMLLGDVGNQLAHCTPKQLQYVSKILLPALLLRDDLEHFD